MNIKKFAQSILPGYSILMILLLVTIVTCNTSCRTVKSEKITSEITEQRKDSTVIIERVKFDTVSIKRDTTMLSIPFHLLRDSMLTYMEKSNGRAKVIIERIGDTIHLHAKCDSLEKVIATTERNLERWRDIAVTSAFTKNTVKVDVPFYFKLLLILAVVMGVLSTVKTFFSFK